MTEPTVTIVIPVYNEEGILSASVADLTEKLASEPLWQDSYEILLSENGSTDRTVEVANELMERHPELRLLRNPEPNYGLAMRNGIIEARGEIVICDEIDLCDTDFYVRALEQIRDHDYDLVVGSKALDRSRDQRPGYRKLATLVLNSLLRVFLGFHGTDTHGLKAFRKDRLLGVIDRCVVEKDLFASEFVIRAERMNFRMTEIPVTIVEKRPPSINLARRVPNVL
jgi:glycosyltransferase involved in cell wall biosynthesis